MDFKNLIMDHSKLNQAFTRSQRSTVVDRNNVEDPPSGVKNKRKADTEGLKFSSVNFGIYIPNGRNTTLHDTAHINSTMKTSQGKDC